jgi:ABC-type nitrate/sulfonate/bicarbonate transport system substrate-binding protein
LENETIVIGGPAAIAALVSGNVDFSGAGGSGLRAAAKGAELKAVMCQTEKVTWYFVVHPSIKQVSDLKGKKVGVGLIGDSKDRFSTMFVERGGLSAKDITRIPMGPSSGARIAAIKSGSLHVAVLDPGGMIVAEKEGLHSLAFLGDLFPFAVPRLRRHRQEDRREPGANQALGARDGSLADVFARSPGEVGGHRHKKTSVGRHQSRHGCGRSLSAT